MVLNSTGQGSSVFQLLIAAVVALAILGVLGGVLGIIPGILDVGQDPTKAAADTLKTAVTSPSALKASGQVTFRDGTFLNVRGIANAAQSGVTAEDLCLSMGDFKDNTRGFESIAGGETIRYSGSATQTIKLEVLCDFGEDGLEGALESYDLDSRTDISSCDFDTSGQNPLVCVVALRIAR